MARRYRLNKDEFEVYNKMYNQIKNKSTILYPSMNGANSFDLNIPSLLNEFLGDESGFIKDDNAKEKQKAYIPILSEKLNEIPQRYAEINAKLLSQGKRPLKEMPLDLINEQFEIEAKIDVCEEEVQRLYLMQKEKEDAKRLSRKSSSLKYGCSGIASLRGGILAIIDGQNVKLVMKGKNKGLLIIDEPESPFNGMLVQDYREFVQAPWKKAINELQLRKSKFAQVLKYQCKEDEFEELWLKESAKIVQENNWGWLFSTLQKGKPSVPSWPVGVEKYLKD